MSNNTEFEGYESLQRPEDETTFYDRIQEEHTVTVPTNQQLTQTVNHEQASEKQKYDMKCIVLIVGICMIIIAGLSAGITYAVMKKDMNAPSQREKLASTLGLTQDDGAKCLSCKGVKNTNDCQTMKSCRMDNVCYMVSYVSTYGDHLFEYGFVNSQSCPVNKGPLFGTQLQNNVTCTKCCLEGDFCNKELNCSLTSKTKDLPNDCSDVKKQSPNATSGVYIIYIGVDKNPFQSIAVYCVMPARSGEAWTVFQRRLNGSVNFYRDWVTYKNGFGTPLGEYWIGNDVLHVLTSSSAHQLRIEMTDFDGKTMYAEYAIFRIGDESSGYNITLNGFTGNAFDCLTNTTHREALTKGTKFSTYDVENDIDNKRNCAKVFKGGWWYRSCHCANLNGLYLAGHHDSYADGVNWWRQYYSLKTSLMMIRKV